MIRKDILVHKTKTLLDDFINPMLGQLDKPRQRFLRQTVRAILFSGSVVVMELCKWIRDKCSDRFYQDKRLLNNLLSPHANFGRAFTDYRRSLNRYIQPEIPIAIDMTDLAKLRARQMKYLALVRDGSEGKLVTRHVDAFHFLIMGNRNKYIEKLQIINVKYRFVELVSTINQVLPIQNMFALE